MCKVRNVVEETPKKYQYQVSKRLTKAYDMVQYEDATNERTDLVRELELVNQSSARSLEERTKGTLALHKLGISQTLRKTLQSANLIEAAIFGVGTAMRNVKRWTDAGRVERRPVAEPLESGKNRTRIKDLAWITYLVDDLENANNAHEQAA